MENKESGHDKFKRLAMSRTNGVLKNLRSLAKLSNSRRYDYNKDDIDKIFKAIHNDLKISRAMFDKNLNNKKFEL
tara:strand:- start:33 stop:257 length:225 start_codon:yes stop_codon:yes gene_type:complete